MAAKFRLQNRHGGLILNKICHFQPFPKFELSKTFSWGPAIFGQRKAYNSANTDGSQVPFAESSWWPHFKQNMSLSAISKI